MLKETVTIPHDAARVLIQVKKANKCSLSDAIALLTKPYMNSIK